MTPIAAGFRRERPARAGCPEDQAGKLACVLVTHVPGEPVHPLLCGEQHRRWRPAFVILRSGPVVVHQLPGLPRIVGQEHTAISGLDDGTRFESAPETDTPTFPQIGFGSPGFLVNSVQRTPPSVDL